MNETGSECNTAPEPAGWSDRPGKRQSPSKKSAGFPVMAKILSCIHSLFGNLLILSCKTESPANGLDSPLRKNGLQKKKKEKQLDEKRIAGNKNAALAKPRMGFSIDSGFRGNRPSSPRRYYSNTDTPPFQVFFLASLPENVFPEKPPVPDGKRCPSKPYTSLPHRHAFMAEKQPPNTDHYTIFINS